ncbi:hypothetical protein [Nocardioides speluncae]|uniref:hypothetical protein n=1 Tax=Nocardioides speluncae TaxID=2670337 RepID=UPI00137B0AF5|nr:hypothetical protein [Nocardioides speluncae]
MNGPEHYREAERLLALAVAELDQFKAGVPHPTDVSRACSQRAAAVAAVADVHATLALAAATAYPAVKDYCGDESNDSRNWAGVTS